MRDVCLVEFSGALEASICGIELSCIVHALGLNSCFELAQNASLTNYLFIRHLSVLIPTPPPCRLFMRRVGMPKRVNVIHYDEDSSGRHRSISSPLPTDESEGRGRSGSMTCPHPPTP